MLARATSPVHGARNRSVYAKDTLEDYVGWVDVPRFFPETGHNVDGDFHTHFWEYGGVDTFGFPLSEAYWTPGDGADGGGDAPGLITQYFQRARLEYDLTSHELRRSPLGTLMGKHQPAVAPLPGVRYFRETGHNVGQSFLQYYEQMGGSAALGLPLSEEVQEHGRAAQWFERVRLEWWPDESQRVQLGLIGEEHLREHLDEIPEQALAPAEPLPPLREWVLPAQPPPPRIAWAPLDVPILYYHQVPSQKSFQEQLRALLEAGRQIVPLGRVVAALRGEGPALPAKPLVLTFDDGWVPPRCCRVRGCPPPSSSSRATSGSCPDTCPGTRYAHSRSWGTRSSRTPKTTPA
jgi:hypothetical protein